MSSHATLGDRLGTGELQGEDFEPGLGHTIPVHVLNQVIFSLVTLTVLTVAVSRVNFGHWNIIIALLIATIKAGIVVSFFMHLKFEGPTILLYVFYPLIILFLFIGGSFVDVAARNHVHPVGIEEKLPQPVIVGAEAHGASGHEPSSLETPPHH